MALVLYELDASVHITWTIFACFVLHRMHSASLVQRPRFTTSC